MSHSIVRFLWDNWIAEETLANSDVSSEQAAFPIENAYNSRRRSKVWRSSGYWKIKAENNGIAFSEGGPTLYASITVQAYNSTALFMAGLKAALEAAGANTYTVTQNSNYRFNISSSGGTFSLITTDPLFTSAEILGFDDSVDYTGATQYTADLLRIHTSEWVLWDMGIASNPNAFALIQQRNKAIDLTETALITLKGNHTNPPDWDAPVYEAVIPYDDEVIAKVTTEASGVLATQALRYWRLEITDQNPLGYISAGAFFLGLTYVPTGGCAVFPLDDDLVDLTQTIRSEGGQSFSDILPKTEDYNFSFNMLNKDDVEEIKEYWDRFGTGVPFFILLDSVNAFSSSINRQLKFVKFLNEPKFKYFSPGKWSMTVNLREEL
jgi:hypothetical protein